MLHGTSIAWLERPIFDILGSQTAIRVRHVPFQDVIIFPFRDHNPRDPRSAVRIFTRYCQDVSLYFPDHTIECIIVLQHHIWIRAQGFERSLAHRTIWRCRRIAIDVHSGTSIDQCNASTVYEVASWTFYKAVDQASVRIRCRSQGVGYVESPGAFRQRTLYIQ